MMALMSAVAKAPTTMLARRRTRESSRFPSTRLEAVDQRGRAKRTEKRRRESPRCCRPSSSIATTAPSPAPPDSPEQYTVLPEDRTRAWSAAPHKPRLPPTRKPRAPGNPEIPDPHGWRACSVPNAVPDIGRPQGHRSRESAQHQAAHHDEQQKRIPRVTAVHSEAR